MAEMAIFYDASKCTACKGCQVACKQWNQLPSPLTAEEFEFTKSYQSPLEVSPDTWIIMTFDEVDLDIGVEWNFMRRACFHCGDAACLQACPVGAISKKDSGAVVIDQEKCIGCQYCTNACPFDIPKWKEAENKTFKCWLCQDRLANDRHPGCVTTCPTGALSFGMRTDMVAQAKEALQDVKAQGFNDAEVYGIDELDGMHVLFLAHRGLEAHGLIRDPKVPDMIEFWQFLKPLGGVAFAAAVGGLGLSYLSGIGYKRDGSDDSGEVKK